MGRRLARNVRYYSWTPSGQDFQRPDKLCKLGESADYRGFFLHDLFDIRMFIREVASMRYGWLRTNIVTS
jgi:hypothetical protein